MDIRPVPSATRTPLKSNRLRLLLSGGRVEWSALRFAKGKGVRVVCVAQGRIASDASIRRAERLASEAGTDLEGGK